MRPGFSIFNKRKVVAIAPERPGLTEPVMGYTPGRLFDPGALRQTYRTRQNLPWYSVIGPGSPIQRQAPCLPNKGVAMQQKSLQTFSAFGPGIQSGETLQQPLTLVLESQGGTSTSTASASL